VARFAFDPEQSQVWIEGSSTVHPIHATATGLDGWLEVDTDADGVPERDADLAGEIAIEVEGLRSGNSLVDRETRRRIDSRRYPTIVGVIDRGRVGSDGSADVTGTIGFRGESRQVEGTLELTVTGPTSLVIDGSSRFDVRDWGLDPPRLLALRVHPEVDVRVHVVARQ
jgi:polyisoprenoid-binding protein YceI